MRLAKHKLGCTETLHLALPALGPGSAIASASSSGNLEPPADVFAFRCLERKARSENCCDTRFEEADRSRVSRTALG